MLQIVRSAECVVEDCRRRLGEGRGGEGRGCDG